MQSVSFAYIFKLLILFPLYGMVLKKGQKGELQKEMFNKFALHLRCASSSFDDIFKGNAPF